MKDSLTITAQAIPFLILLTFVLIKIMHLKDNTFWTYCKKKRTHFPANPFTQYYGKFRKNKNNEKSSV